MRVFGPNLLTFPTALLTKWTTARVRIFQVEGGLEMTEQAYARSCIKTSALQLLGEPKARRVKLMSDVLHGSSPRQGHSVVNGSMVNGILVNGFLTGA